MHQHMWWTINVDRTAGELLGRLESHLLAMICHDFMNRQHATNPIAKVLQHHFWHYLCLSNVLLRRCPGSGIATLQKTLGRYSRHQQHQQTSSESTWKLTPVLVRTIVSWPLGLRVARFRLFGDPQFTNSSFPTGAGQSIPWNRSGYGCSNSVILSHGGP